MSEILDLLAEIETQPELEEKFKLFARFMADEFHYTGVNYGLYLDTSSRNQIVDGFVAKRHGLPDEWRLRYQREGFGKRDCALLMGALGSKPMLQTQFYQLAADDRLQPEFVEVVQAVRDHVQCGVVIPVQANGLRAVIGLYDQSGDSKQHDQRFEKNRKRIETLAALFHRSCHWDQEVQAQRGLSDLNLSVLQLKARGLRVKEILHEIERNNPKTVDNHMLRVRRALSAQTDAEAIAKAAALGLLVQKEDSRLSESSISDMVLKS